MEEQLRDSEFVAYGRKLLRSLCELRNLLDEKQYDEMKTLLDDLIEDTINDIEQ